MKESPKIADNGTYVAHGNNSNKEKTQELEEQMVVT